ncbi:MAG: PEP-CTERM/exosortase system-associated acyltransferase [Candidatus Competibacter sp.]|nr:PEP-CTERM/exosortase system-associated acyltransferase [Candidatus Competibacter sp.]MDG4606512.1 PEP-CTERM/exosortase system-associated acyltransferase [Candidatus Contendobacter sp.]HRD50977.1 PEP-CTERM/exosortase system-associated acyltransferase [Candidatus Contendobacter sp.]
MPLHLKMRPSVNQLFDDGYEVILADTEASRAIHRKIRYQVYCMERGFENPADFATGEENDRWDTHAAQFIVRQRSSGSWVAAMRLVLPYAASFPLETLHCLTPGHADHIQRRQLGEISRICVIRSPNPHHGNPYLDRGFGHVTPDRESEVMLGMLRAITVCSLERGIEYCYLLVTDAFARLLRRIGVVLHSVGAATQHRGLRAPYLIELRESAAASCNQSAAVHALFARAIHAYLPCSVLDNLERAPLPRPAPCWNGAAVTRPYSYRYRPPAPTRQAQRG